MLCFPYHTLGGLVMWLLGRLPQTGDKANWEGWKLEVVDLDGKRVDKVLAMKLPDGSESPEVSRNQASTYSSTDNGAKVS